MLCLEQQKLNGHQKIVRYYDSQVSQLREAFEILILMEFCHGGPVIDLMNRRLQNRLTEIEILHMFSDIVEAVAYMHYMKPPVIHRDLKVENVLLDDSGGYKLCDFGSATTRIIPPLAPLAVKDIQQLEEEISRQTTLQYRSPEMVDVYQRRGMTEKIDIWALGVLLYKLCYYTTPFEDTGALAILSAKYTIPPKPAFSEGLLRIITWTLQEEPMHRPNIYELFASVCRLRHVECPLRNIYPVCAPLPGCPGSGQHVIQQAPQQVQPTPQQSALFAQPQVGPQVSTLADISPMRRGRPAKNQAAVSLEKIGAAFGQDVPTSANNGFDDAFGGPVTFGPSVDPADSAGNAPQGGLAHWGTANSDRAESWAAAGSSISNEVMGPRSASLASIGSAGEAGRISRTPSNNEAAPRRASNAFDVVNSGGHQSAGAMGGFLEFTTAQIGSAISGHARSAGADAAFNYEAGLTSASGAMHAASPQTTTTHGEPPLPTMAMLLPTSYAAASPTSPAKTTASTATVPPDPFAFLAPGLPTSSSSTKGGWQVLPSGASLTLNALRNSSAVKNQPVGGEAVGFPPELNSGSEPNEGRLDEMRLESFNKKYPPPASLDALVFPTGNQASASPNRPSAAQTAAGDSLLPTATFSNGERRSFECRPSKPPVGPLVQSPSPSLPTAGIVWQNNNRRPPGP